MESVGKVRCTQCGFEVSGSSKFCGKCGAPLQIQEPNPQATYQQQQPVVQQVQPNMIQNQVPMQSFQYQQTAPMPQAVSSRPCPSCNNLVASGFDNCPFCGNLTQKGQYKAKLVKNTESEVLYTIGVILMPILFCVCLYFLSNEVNDYYSRLDDTTAEMDRCVLFFFLSLITFLASIGCIIVRIHISRQKEKLIDVDIHPDKYIE